MIRLVINLLLAEKAEENMGDLRDLNIILLIHCLLMPASGDLQKFELYFNFFQLWIAYTTPFQHYWLHSLQTSLIFCKQICHSVFVYNTLPLFPKVFPANCNLACLSLLTVEIVNTRLVEHSPQSAEKMLELDNHTRVKYYPIFIA